MRRRPVRRWPRTRSRALLAAGPSSKWSVSAGRVPESSIESLQATDRFRLFRLLARLFRVQKSVAVHQLLQSLNCSKQATRPEEHRDFAGIVQETFLCSVGRFGVLPTCRLQLASWYSLPMGRFGVQTHPSKLQASACGVTVPVASGYSVPSFPATTTTAGRRRLHRTRCRSQTPAFDGSGLICTSQPAPTPNPSYI
jgi:hypothetical protein